MSLESRIWNIARATTLLLVLVSLRIVYWQLVRGDELRPIALDPLKASSQYAKISKERKEDTQAAVDYLSSGKAPNQLENLPQPVVQRTIDLLETIRRGSIFDRNGRLLAVEKQDDDGNRFRFYSEPSLAHVIGYVSGMQTGVTGLELSYNEDLLGLNRPDSQIEQLLHKPIDGNDLILTIDSSIQRAAENALRGKRGAILTLDAHSGAILAMASAPRYDPNRVLDPAYLEDLLTGCNDQPGCGSPFLNRATQALYPPGSTWKTVSLIAALDTHQVTPDTVFDFGDPIQSPNGPYYIYTVDGGVIPDPNHRENKLNLEMSYAKSANAAFARIGDEMPPDTLVDYAARFGFGAPGEIRFPLEVDSSSAQLAQKVDSLYENNLLRAVTAIGQGELLTAPIHTAMVVLSVLNAGDIPMPYLVQAIREPSGALQEDLPNRQWLRRRMTPQTASQVKRMMVSVVEKGSGKKAALPGATVGGKTGTAQVGGDRLPHAWFAGFAENSERSVVVVVLVENGGEGSQVAAPIFAEIAKAALENAGKPVEEIVPTPISPTREAPAMTPGASPPAATPTPEDEKSEIQVTATNPSQPTPAPSPTAAPDVGGVPAPDIPRDPDKKDITAANPTCANEREVPQGTGQFIWPSQFQALSGGDFKEGHPGIDLNAPPGSPVFAADTGLVIFAGWSGLGYGNAILIDHGNGFQTLYAHLSQISTYCGAKVEQSKLIGMSGNTGNSSGPHLHFEVRVPGGYLNPLKVLPLP